jgi:Peptidase family M28
MQNIQMRRTAVLVAAALALVPAAGGQPAFDAGRAHSTVRQIAALGPRPAGSVAERAVGRIVAARLRAAGYRVVVQSVPLPQGGRSLNVVGVPRSPVRAVVSAHLDGVSEGPAANDNASGLSVLLGIARATARQDGVLLAALGAEERAETGSPFHLGAARLLRRFSAAGRRRIRLALNLDMVGVGTRLHVRGIEAVPNRSARAALATARRLGLRVTYLPDPGWSDHAELTRGGMPAAWIQWRDDRCWHRACDRARRVVPEKLRAAAAVVLAALESA